MSKYIEEGVGRVRRRPNPLHFDKSPEAEEYLDFRTPFAIKIPPGSQVWKDRTKQDYGTTVGANGAYNSAFEWLVYVENINSDSELSWERWDTRMMLLKEEPVNSSEVTAN